MIKMQERTSFTDIVNSTLFSPRTSAEECAKDHRYLQEQLFIFVMHFLDEMSENYHNGHYDARNEFSCAKAAAIVDAIFSADNLLEVKYTTMMKKSADRKKDNVRKY